VPGATGLVLYPTAKVEEIAEDLPERDGIENEEIDDAQSSLSKELLLAK